MTPAGILPPRDYQRAAIDKLHEGWSTSGRYRLACVLPTGAGKTVVFAHMAREYAEANPDKRILILVHTDELVSQTVKQLKRNAPGLPIGVVQGTRRDVHARIIVVSVMSLRSERSLAQLRSVGLIIVDECHHAAAATYVKILTYYGCFDGRCKAAGFTATLVRGDKASLGNIWEGVAYKLDIGWMIRARHLINVRGKRVEVDDLDLRKVKMSGGDYQRSALGEAMEASLAPEIVARAYVEHAGERSGVLFAPTISAAQAFADALNDVGVKAEMIHGSMPLAERRAIVARLADGTTQVITNCMVLTEGFDCPRVSCVVVARPTRSAGLYQQMVGRGLRVDPTIPYDDQDCLILDVVGASQAHGLASLVDLSEKPIRLKDDQTLTAAEDELDLDIEFEPLDGDGRSFPKELHNGPTKVVDFDPLADASKYVWNRTRGGVAYLSIGVEADGVYVFVVPSTQPDADPGTYDVLWCTKNPYTQRDGKRGGVTEYVACPLATAFAWGEQVANDMRDCMHINTLSKSAAWRKKPASPKAIDYARQLGCTVPDGATGHDVSLLIDARKATQRIDPVVRAVTGQRATVNA